MAQTTKPKIDTKETIADARAYPIGKGVLSVVDLPIDTKETAVYVSRDGWLDLGPSTPVIEIRQYFSFDGGVTWEFGGASEHVGGALTHWSGRTMPECLLGLSGIPDEKNKDRKIRIEITPVTPLSTSVKLECRSKISDLNIGGIR